MILLNGGNADESEMEVKTRIQAAEKCLESAASDASPDPRFHFHLALAHERLGNVEKARDALKKAHEGRVQDQILSAADRQMLAELEKKLSPK